MSVKHPSHKTRFSFDASTYDEICEYCGHTDQVPGGWGKLAEPCPNAPKEPALSKIEQARQPFLKALEADEDDTPTRLEYGDWLEEQGEDDEAARMRAWPAAKAWMLNWVKSINHHAYKEDENGDEVLDEHGNLIYLEDGSGHPHTYVDAIQAGHKLAMGGWVGWGTDAGASWFRDSHENCVDWFRNWSILTGEAVPDSVMGDPNVSCAC